MKTKRFFAIMITAAIMLVASSCSVVLSPSPEGRADERLTGTWLLADNEENEQFGSALVFYPDGKFGYAFASDVDGEMTAEKAENAAAEMLKVYSVVYSVTADEIFLTYSVLDDYVRMEDKISFSLNGNSLTFDGTKYEKAD